MNDVKDYQCIYKQYKTVDTGRTKLSVTLKTAEFGDMESFLADGTDDAMLNTKVWESLADELIDEYEFKLAKLKS